jgi:hypothetical protein
MALLGLFATPGAAHCDTGTRGLGDILFTIDIEMITGDSRCLGVEFDDVNYWATGAHDFSVNYLYEFSPDGTSLNKYPQPPANWGGWGWRDLCFDSQYLYAGDPNAPYIEQIDPATGQITGVTYGPFPVFPSRGLGYDPSSDSFWSASFSGDLYQCFRDNTYNVFPNPGIIVTGIAFEVSDPSHPMGWLVGNVGSDPWAFEFDPATGGHTGKSFMLSGAPGGACGFDAGEGLWVLGVIIQGVSDQLVAYDLDTQTLTTDTKVIEASIGGTVNFYLDAGKDHAFRNYVIFGSLSGHAPGTPLPGGMTVLPVNWDPFTSLFLSLNLTGFFGSLNGLGTAWTFLVVNPFPLSQDITITFGFALQGPPWDFASNYVELLIKKS